MTVVGFGMGVVIAPLSAAVMGAVLDARSGIASGINNALSRIAGLIAVAAMGSLASYIYGVAGGDLSYGETVRTTGHVQAMEAAFAAIAWVSATLAATSSVLALVFIRHTPGAKSSARL